jgi:hypothetical protein
MQGECNVAPKTPAPAGGWTVTPADLGECRATVDQVDQCYADLVALTRTVMAALDCSAAAADAAVTTQAPLPTTCQAIEATCQALFS